MVRQNKWGQACHGCCGTELTNPPACRHLSALFALVLANWCIQPAQGPSHTDPLAHLRLPLSAVVGVTTETELALAIQDRERYIRLDGHIGLTGAFKSPQVRRGGGLRHSLRAEACRLAGWAWPAAHVCQQPPLLSADPKPRALPMLCRPRCRPSGPQSPSPATATMPSTGGAASSMPKQSVSRRGRLGLDDRLPALPGSSACGPASCLPPSCSTHTTQSFHCLPPLPLVTPCCLCKRRVFHTSSPPLPPRPFRPYLPCRQLRLHALFLRHL